MKSTPENAFSGVLFIHGIRAPFSSAGSDYLNLQVFGAPFFTNRVL